MEFQNEQLETAHVLSKCSVILLFTSCWLGIGEFTLNMAVRICGRLNSTFFVGRERIGMASEEDKECAQLKGLTFLRQKAFE